MKHNSNVIEFEDVNFENLIREQLNKPTGAITTTDVLSIAEIIGYGRGIQSLGGIESFIYLKNLYLSTNQISDLTPLSELINLEEIGLLNNKISDLSPLSGLTKITYIGIQSNLIENIQPLKSLTKLHLLKIGNNLVTDIEPLTQNQGLGQGDKVNLVGNPLNEVSVDTYIPILQARGVIVVY